MKQKWWHLIPAFLLVLLVVLAGCGGNSSPASNNNSHVGTWEGGWVIPGLNQSGGLQITIAADGKLSGKITNDTDGNSAFINGTSNNTSFSFTYQYTGSPLSTVNGTLTKYNDELIGNFSNTVEGGLSYTGTFDANNPSAANANLLINGDTEVHGAINWIPWNNNPGVKPTSNWVSGFSDFSGYYTELSSTNCATHEYHVGISHRSRIILKSGKTYTIKIKIKSDNPGRLNLALANSFPPYENYTRRSIYTTTTATVYTHSFASTIDDPNAAFIITFGNTTADTDDAINPINNNGKKFYIDDVELTEQITPDSITPVGSPLLPDSGFDAGTWFGWNDVTKSATEFEFVTVPGIDGFSGQYLHFKSPDCGSEGWQVQLWPSALTTIALTSGKTYTVSFKARSSTTGILQAVITGPDSANYFSYTVNTSNTTQTYTCKFIFNGPNRTGEFVIFFGNIRNDNVDFYLDDVQVFAEDSI